MRERLGSLDSAVIPGFYGAYADGTVKTFSRGGSDITGSIVARAIKANVYENWTDVSGFLIADPRIYFDFWQVLSTIHVPLSSGALVLRILIGMPSVLTGKIASSCSTEAPI